MKKEYKKPEVTCIGSIEELTLTNQTNQLSDVPYGNVLQVGFS